MCWDTWWLLLVWWCFYVWDTFFWSTVCGMILVWYVVWYLWCDTCVVVGYWTLGQQHTNQSHLPDITPATIFPNDDDRWRQYVVGHRVIRKMVGGEKKYKTPIYQIVSDITPPRQSWLIILIWWRSMLSNVFRWQTFVLTFKDDFNGFFVGSQNGQVGNRSM